MKRRDGNWAKPLIIQVKMRCIYFIQLGLLASGYKRSPPKSRGSNINIVFLSEITWILWSTIVYLQEFVGSAPVLTRRINVCRRQLELEMNFFTVWYQINYRKTKCLLPIVTHVLSLPVSATWHHIDCLPGRIITPDFSHTDIVVFVVLVFVLLFDILIVASHCKSQRKRKKRSSVRNTWSSK